MHTRPSKPKRPRDLNQLAYQIVQEATDEAARDTEADPADSDKNPAAVALGRLGGRKGGLARAKKLSQEQRHTIAQKAARARWRKD
jgi:hypothetical protein